MGAFSKFTCCVRFLLKAKRGKSKDKSNWSEANCKETRSSKAKGQESRIKTSLSWFMKFKGGDTSLNKRMETPDLRANRKSGDTGLSQHLSLHHLSAAYLLVELCT